MYILENIDIYEYQLNLNKKMYVIFFSLYLKTIEVLLLAGFCLWIDV